jgi:uncharacterized protein (TIGR03000 family)
MFQKMFLFNGVLFAAILTPVFSHAQSYAGSGPTNAAGVGGYHSAYYGGAVYGGNYYGNSRTYMSPRYQYSYTSPAYGYSGYYPFYGYYPDYYRKGGYLGSGSSYDSSDSSSLRKTRPDPYPYDNPALQPDLRDSGSYGPLGPDYAYRGFTRDNAVVRPDATAHITVSVPQNSEVWFDGFETSTSGTVRTYQSPPLAPGNRYTYEIRARWNENGREMIQMQRVEVTAGSRVSVNFPVPAKSSAQPSTAKTD